MEHSQVTRRMTLGSAVATTVTAIAATAPGQARGDTSQIAATTSSGTYNKPYVKVRDGTNIYVKDWGNGQPVILIHGWPLNADMYDRTAMRLAASGYRVINYDRRGMGRSNQPYEGYDWDTLTDDLADVMQATGATDNVSILGYSMGGAEAARYMSRYKGKSVTKIGLLASITPGILQSHDNPHGDPGAGYNEIAKGITDDPAKFFKQSFLPPFYGIGGTYRANQQVIDAAVTTALTSGMKPLINMAHSFSFGDFVADMPAITVPTLIMHGTEDKPVPFQASALRAHKMIAQSQLIAYEGHPHGFYATNGDQMDKDLLKFLQA